MAVGPIRPDWREWEWAPQVQSILDVLPTLRGPQSCSHEALDYVAQPYSDGDWIAIHCEQCGMSESGFFDRDVPGIPWLREIRQNAGPCPHRDADTVRLGRHEAEWATEWCRILLLGDIKAAMEGKRR